MGALTGPETGIILESMSLLPLLLAAACWAQKDKVVEAKAVPERPATKLSGSTVSDPKRSQFDAIVAKCGEFLKHRKALDWKEIAGSAPVIYLGEWHPNAGIKRELRAHLADLKAAGVTHLALEMFADDEQPRLDDYCSRKSCDDDVLASLRTQWGWKDDHVDEEYLELVREARDAGFALVALDLPRREDWAQREKNVKNSDSWKEWKSHNRNLLSVRDGRMARNIARVFEKDPKARVFAYVGAYHAQLTNQPAHLEQYHIDAKSYVLMNDDDPMLAPWMEAVRVNGLTGQRMLIPQPHVNDQKKLWSSDNVDGLLSVPELYTHARVVNSK